MAVDPSALELPSRSYRWGVRWGLAYAAASLLLLGLVFQGSFRLVGPTFQGFLVWDNGVLVAFHEDSWTGVQAGLPLNGGRLLEVDGRPFSGGRALQAYAEGLATGTPVRYRVLADGVVREHRVPTMRLSVASYVVTFGNYLFSAALLLTIGALALMLRPDRRPSRAFALALGALGALIALAIDYMTSYRLVPVCQILEGLTPVALANFFLLYPVERTSQSTRRAARGAAGALLLALSVVGILVFESRPEVARGISVGFYVLIALTGLLSVASFVEALLRAGRPEARTQAAVVLAGALPALALPAIAMLAFTLLGWTFSTTWWTVLLPLFPLATLYAIVWHDFLDAERFVRLSVGYTVSISALIIVYALGLELLEQWTWLGVTPSRTADFVLLIGLVLGIDPLRRRAQTAIDRVFYRSRIDFAKTLENSSTELALLGADREIVQYVSAQLRDTLALESAEVLLGPGVPDGPAIVEPISFRGDRLGSIACGLKRSGAPFSAAERDLVRGVAAQVAVALHNAATIQALSEANEALVRNVRLAAIGEFAGAVAHAIRNPLAGIRATAQLAQRKTEEAASADALETIVGEADWLERRIRGLLDFSRPYALSRRTTDLGELVHSVARSIQRRNDAQAARVVVDVPEGAAEWDVDPAYLEEALTELSVNALRAMPDGGELRLELRTSERSAVITVQDTGSGVPEGVRDLVFDLFFTTHPQGTGMGLATVKKSVEAHGGRVEVERTGPGGTAIRLELPRATG